MSRDTFQWSETMPVVVAVALNEHETVLLCKWLSRIREDRPVDSDIAAAWLQRKVHDYVMKLLNNAGIG